MTVWMRTLEDVSRLEAAIEEQLPEVRIADPSVVMRTTKRVCTLLAWQDLSSPTLFRSDKVLHSGEVSFFPGVRR